MDKQSICCFTGHRDLPISDQRKIFYQLERIVIDLIFSGVQSFAAGGARGFDTLAAQTILKLRRTYPHIKLILILPCLSQTKGWRSKDIHVYEAIKAEADEVIYTSQAYTRGCMQKRNRYLVDHSNICICYLTKSTGGTAYTVNYAKKKGLKIINLADKTN